jgi:tripartite-type tricarboxylate transporter receptor subunit TctC
MRHARVVSLGVATLFVALGGPASADWPDDKPIEIVVGFAPGGGTDLLARRIAPAIAKHLGGKANFVIVNRPGASGELALVGLSRSAPNGYSLGIISAPSFLTAALHHKPQYDAAALAVLARVVEDPTVMVIRADSPIKTLGDLVAQLKAKPGSVTLGNNGLGTNGHMAALALQAAGQVELNLIPFKGTSDARTALLGGHVDIIAMGASEFVTDPATGFRVLAQFGATRAPSLPAVATAREQGFDAVVSSERGIAVPKGLPDDIAARLEKAIAAAAVDADFLRSASSDELSIAYLSGAEWTRHLAAERAKYEAIWRASPSR